MKLKKFFQFVLPIGITIVLSFPGISQTTDWKIIHPTTAPAARFGHSTTTLPDGKILLFGGESIAQDMYNDLHSYDGGEWTLVTPTTTAPPARSRHCAWFTNGKFYVHGGIGNNFQPINDLWNYDPTTKEWTPIDMAGNHPSARMNHEAVVLSDGNVLISGGYDGSNELDDLWKYEPATNQWTQISTLPGAVESHVAQIVDNTLYIFYFTQGYSYNLSSGNWTTGLQTPSILSGASSLVGQNQSGEKIIFIFGGLISGGTYTDKVHEYNTASGIISQQAMPMPAGIYKGAIAWLGTSKDYNHAKAVFFGGATGNWSNMIIQNQTWEYEIGIPSLVSENPVKKGITVYPSPSTGCFHLGVPDDMKNYSVSVYDLYGRCIWHSKNPVTYIDISHCNPSLYTVVVHNEKHQLTTRLIIQ